MSGKKHIVLLHGWGLGAGVWAEFQQNYLPDMRISAPDIFTNQTAGDPRQLFETALERINHYAGDTSATIAWSLGGLLAFEAAVRHPNRKLILLNSTPCFAARNDWPNGLDGNAIDSLRLQCREDPEAALAYFCGLAASGERARHKITRYLRTIAANQKNDGAVLASWLQILADLDCREQYKKLPGPIYVLLGEKDHLVSPKIEKQLIQLNRKSRIEIMPSCGHVPFLSRPEDTAKFIQRALA